MGGILTALLQFGFAMVQLLKVLFLVIWRLHKLQEMKGDYEHPAVPLSPTPLFLNPGIELSSFADPDSLYSMIYCHRPRARGLAIHGPKPPPTKMSPNKPFLVVSYLQHFMTAVEI